MRNPKVKRILAAVVVLVILVAMCMPMFIAYAAETPSTIKINKEAYTFKTKPIERDGIWFYPLRELCEKVGGEVLWLPDPRAVKCTYGAVSAILTIDSIKLRGDCCSLDLGHAPFIVDGKTYVSLEGFCKAMQFSYNYYGDDPFSFLHW